MISIDTGTAVLIGLAGALASVVYIGQVARKVVKALETYAGLPAAHARLAEQTEENTMAIKRLTLEVRRLARVEEGKQ